MLSRALFVAKVGKHQRACKTQGGQAVHFRSLCGAHCAIRFAEAFLFAYDAGDVASSSLCSHIIA